MGLSKTDKEFIGDKIKRLCFEYSINYGYGDDLRGALSCAIQSLGLSKIEAMREIAFILKYESGEEWTNAYNNLIEELKGEKDFNLKGGLSE